MTYILPSRGSKTFSLKDSISISHLRHTEKEKKNQRNKKRVCGPVDKQSDMNYSRETSLEVPAMPGSLSFSASNDKPGSQEGDLAILCLEVANKPAQSTLYFNSLVI